MTNCCYLFICMMLPAVLAFNKTNGQTSSSDELASFKNSIAYFQNEMGADIHLYTGKEYTPYEKGIKGNPFFFSAEMENNDVFYDGTLYTNVPLLFDIVRQEIVVNRYNQNVRITLLNEKVKYFTLAGHRFENIALNEGKDESAGNTIYDLVFNGRASVYVKRSKRIKNPVKAEDPPEFVEEDMFYIRNGSILYAVDNRSTLLQALKDKNELIKAYLRKNGFKFKKKLEKELIMTAAYYSTLNQ
jgi:hypothetical protein